MSISKKIVEVASRYVGIKEIPQNAGWKDKDFEKKMRDMGWIKGQAWCMYFVKLVLIEAFQELKNDDMVKWCKANLNGGVLSSYRKMKSKWELLGVDNAEEGSIGIMRKGDSELGHVFIVESVNNDVIKCIEGNTSVAGSREGDGVYRRTRMLSYMKKSELKIIDFVRVKHDNARNI